MQEGDIKFEELNVQECSNDFKEEQEKSDIVFEENVNLEEIESKVICEERMDFLNKNVEVCKNNIKFIVEKCKDNNNMKIVVEIVEQSEILFKVFENGGSDDVNDVVEKK